MTPDTTPSETATDMDLVDRIFDYLEGQLPRDLQAAGQLGQLRTQMRAEFAGARSYIPSVARHQRGQRIEAVLRLYNGRNAMQIAQQLQMSRASVYRIIKQYSP